MILHPDLARVFVDDRWREAVALARRAEQVRVARRARRPLWGRRAW
jgi:hypothetical protein